MGGENGVSGVGNSFDCKLEYSAGSKKPATVMVCYHQSDGTVALVLDPTITLNAEQAKKALEERGYVLIDKGSYDEETNIWAFRGYPPEQVSQMDFTQEEVVTPPSLFDRVLHFVGLY